MSKVKISEVAEETAKTSKQVLEACEELKISAKAAGSPISEGDAERLMDFLINGKSAAPVKKAPATKSTTKDSVKTEDLEKEPSSEKVEAAPAPTQEISASARQAARKENRQKKKEETGEVKEAEVKDAPESAIKSTSSAIKKSETKKPLVMARKGLRIVKKKRPAVVEKEKPKAIESSVYEGLEITNSYGKNKVSVSDNDNSKKKVKKSTGVSRKSSSAGERLNLMANRALGEIKSFDDEDENVMLPDLTQVLRDEQREETPSPAKKQQKPGTQNRPNQFRRKPSGIARGKAKKRKKRDRIDDEARPTAITIPEDIRVYEFAEKMNVPMSEVIKELFTLGLMVTKNDFLDNDALEILGESFEVEITIKDVIEELENSTEKEEIEQDPNAKERPPIVTIMGHVDHGKTSLLDYIREAKVAHGEAGGITQHIGAYTIEKDGKEITFIDTPGHEAFTAMRARGAHVTDVVIIVVAADDGVMPQTKEAINHAKASGAPIIVAINKMDKETANPDFVKSGLAELGVTPTDWGGEVDCIGVSAKTGEGVDDLLDHILTTSELLELKANPEAEAQAVVIESSIEKGRGTVATIIVQNGTLCQGDSVIAGTSFGRIRAIMDPYGKRIKRLLPSEAGEIIGLDSSPSAGETLVVMDNDKEIRELANKRKVHARERELSKSTKATLDDLHALIAEGQLKTLPIVLKADVQGTLEALHTKLDELRNDEVKVHVIHDAVGAISESDIELAGASEHAMVLGFHVKPTQVVKNKAKSLGVEIRTYDIIYDLLDDVKLILSGMLSPVTTQEVAGRAEVREIFKIPSAGTIAGCMVNSGTIFQGNYAKVLRGEDVIYEGDLNSLKRFRDDVKEVAKGVECGIAFDEFEELERGDVIECYKDVKVKVEFAHE
jgi:translation initiation factor IF-2